MFSAGASAPRWLASLSDQPSLNFVGVREYKAVGVESLGAFFGPLFGTEYPADYPVVLDSLMLGVEGCHREEYDVDWATALRPTSGLAERPTQKLRGSTPAFPRRSGCRTRPRS